MTVTEREHMYSRKETKWALEAGRFVKNAGYPSKVGAIKMIRDENIANILYSVDDVKRYYDLYGSLPAALRGKATQRKASITNQVER